MVASDQHSNKIQCGVTQNADKIWCILWVKSLACVLTYCPLGNMVVILYVLFSIKLSYLYVKTCLDNNLQANRRKIIAWIDNCQVDQVFHVVIKRKKMLTHWSLWRIKPIILMDFHLFWRWRLTWSVSVIDWNMSVCQWNLWNKMQTHIIMMQTFA